MSDDLPKSLRELVPFIGREGALLLAGAAPVQEYVDSRGARRQRRVVYVPHTLRPDHWLVRVLGYQRADRLVWGVGGSILHLPSCASMRRRARNRAIRELHDEGVPIETLATLFDIAPRTVEDAWSA